MAHEFTYEYLCCCGHDYQDHMRAWAQCEMCECAVAHNPAGWIKEVIHEVKVCSHPTVRIGEKNEG